MLPLAKRLLMAISIGSALLTRLAAAVATGDEPDAVRCHLKAAPDSDLRFHVPAIVIPHTAKAPNIDGVLDATEWDCAESIDQFLVLGTTMTAEPTTEAWLCVDADRLYAAFRCHLVPGVGPKAEIQEHDGYDVWNDDAIELFVWPDASKPRYYQFISNCRGIRLETSHTIVQGKDIQPDWTWSPPWQAKTGREEGAWTLEMAIPLAILGISPHGSRAIRLNICRDIWVGERKIATWSWLPTKGYDIHLQPQDFGVGVCTFGGQRGRPRQLPKVEGLREVDLVTTESEGNLLLLPGGYEATARVSLPAPCFADGAVSLEVSIRPILAGGKEGDAVPVGRFRLTSPAPVKVQISADSFKPGDFKLRFRALGPGFASCEDRDVSARRAPIEPDVVGTIVIDDYDWRVPGAVAKSLQVEHRITPGLLLQTQFDTPVLAFDPTQDETITCMTEFKGKLYIGSCTQPAATETGSVLVYDPDLDVCQKVFQVNEEGLVRMKVYGDRLYIPGYDANDGGWDLGNIYIHDGESWIERRTVPRAIHIYGLVVYHDRIYVSADIFDAPPEGLPFQEALDKGMLYVYGRVVSSGDGGLTWREEYRGKRSGQDVGFMTVFQDKIVLNAAGDLVVFDGERWAPLGLNPAVLVAYDYAVEGDTLLLATPIGVCFFDGTRFWRSSRFWTVRDRGLVRFGDWWILAGYWIPGTYAGHGPGGTGYPPLKHKETLHFGNSLVAAPPDVLMESSDDGEGEPRWWQRVKYIRPEEMCVSVHSFRGRVYLGTHPEGRVLVLPVVRGGTLTSAPHRVDEAGGYRLWWSGSTPPGTSAGLQVRSASSVDDLAKQPFVGPDGTSKSWFGSDGMPFEIREPGFVQYKVALRTQHPARTPYVQRVVFTISD